jgi:hypothetical protein
MPGYGNEFAVTHSEARALMLIKEAVDVFMIANVNESASSVVLNRNQSPTVTQIILDALRYPSFTVIGNSKIRERIVFRERSENRLHLGHLLARRAKPGLSQCAVEMLCFEVSYADHKSPLAPNLH